MLQRIGKEALLFELEVQRNWVEQLWKNAVGHRLSDAIKFEKHHKTLQDLIDALKE